MRTALKGLAMALVVGVVTVGGTAGPAHADVANPPPPKESVRTPRSCHTSTGVEIKPGMSIVDVFDDYTTGTRSTTTYVCEDGYFRQVGFTLVEPLVGPVS